MVTAVDVRLQLEVLETRREIDRMLARASAKRATPAERKSIVDLAQATEQAVENGDIREFLRHDAELNVWLTRAARNSVAAGIAGPLHSVSRRFWFYHLGEDGVFNETASLHLAIVRAIAVADADKAAEASDQLIDHLVQFTTGTLPGH